MLKALVVDDCHTNRVLLKKRLEKLSIEVTLAADGREAIEKFLSGAFSIVFLDIQMPEMDGCEVVQELRKHNPNVPFIAWTCSVDPESLDLKQFGFTDVLDKPLTTQSFRHIAAAHLGGVYGAEAKDEQGAEHSDSLADDLHRLDYEPGVRELNLRGRLRDTVGEVLLALNDQNWDEAKFLIRKVRGAMKTAGLEYLARELKVLELTCDLRQEELFLQRIGAFPLLREMHAELTEEAFSL